MIVSRAPYRVSFFGGGTDYPEWYEEHGGMFLSSTINHYVTIILRKKPTTDEFRYRVVWKELEDVNASKDIKHPFVRKAIEHRKLESSFDTVYFGDLPHGSGLGSSSAFGVAFLNALNAAHGVSMSSSAIAYEVFNIERHLLGETVGIQDQFACATGGLNFGVISTSGEVTLEKVNASPERVRSLQDRLVFVYTGKSRHASQIASSKVKNFKEKSAHLKRITELTLEAKQLLESDADLDLFGDLLHESWMLKRSLSQRVSSLELDELYALSKRNGAIGGKILGAGGGGFLMLYVNPAKREGLVQALSDYAVVPVTLSESVPGVLLNLVNENENEINKVWEYDNDNRVDLRLLFGSQK